MDLEKEQVEFAKFVQLHRWIYTGKDLWYKAVPDGVETVTAMKKTTEELFELFKNSK